MKKCRFHTQSWYFQLSLANFVLSTISIFLTEISEFFFSVLATYKMIVLESLIWLPLAGLGWEAARCIPRGAAQLHQVGGQGGQQLAHSGQHTQDISAVLAQPDGR